MRSLLIIAALAVPTYLGYYLLHDPAQRAWVYYVLAGALGLALADTLRRWAPAHVTRGLQSAVGLLWWIELESGQQAVCGLGQWGGDVSTDLCVQWFGPDVYRAILAIAIAGLLTWRPNRQP